MDGCFLGYAGNAFMHSAMRHDCRRNEKASPAGEAFIAVLADGRDGYPFAMR